MRRRHRKNYNTLGEAHELTFSCYHGFPFLKADRVCGWLAEAIDEARHELDFALWAYVFMPNHAHIIVCPRQTVYDIADIKQAIKAPVGAQAIQHLEQTRPDWLTRITRRRGAKTERLFWQSGGGYDRNIDNGRTLLNMIDYIHANPVRKELVVRPRDWYWSSAAWYTDGTTIPLSVDPIPPEWLADA